MTTHKGAGALKYLRRFVWYLASRLLLICVVLGLMVVAFYYAMNMANIYVVLKDGMAYRAQVVMMEADESELSKYFMPSFLEQDQVLLATKQGNSPYKDYNVRGIDHRLEMEWMWCWPWEDTARANIIERIPRIDGRAKGTTADALVAAGGADALYPPDWQSASYRAVLVKENGQWRIRSLTLVQVLTEE